jgi:UDP:flavonoid glycosyltransferase YjiC (YdhE family)
MHGVRILFTFAGGTGHFLPLAPVARAAGAAGHVVAFAGQPRMVPTVEAAGFTAFDTGGDTLLATRERQPLVELDAQREARVVREVFAGSIARERADAVLAVCTDWGPDILVCDEMDFGGVVVAERLGLPHVTVLCLGSRSFVPTELIAEPLNELRAEHGLPPDPDLEMRHRYLVLSPFPPSYLDPAFPLPPLRTPCASCRLSFLGTRAHHPGSRVSPTNRRFTSLSGRSSALSPEISSSVCSQGCATSTSVSS